jgi:hypothetical protein
VRLERWEDQVRLLWRVTFWFKDGGTPVFSDFARLDLARFIARNAKTDNRILKVRLTKCPRRTT